MFKRKYMDTFFVFKILLEGGYIIVDQSQGRHYKYSVIRWSVMRNNPDFWGCISAEQFFFMKDFLNLIGFANGDTTCQYSFYELNWSIVKTHPRPDDIASLIRGRVCDGQ